jgi:hypothetical protein
MGMFSLHLRVIKRFVSQNYFNLYSFFFLMYVWFSRGRENWLHTLICYIYIHTYAICSSDGETSLKELNAQVLPGLREQNWKKQVSSCGKLINTRVSGPKRRESVIGAWWELKQWRRGYSYGGSAALRVISMAKQKSIQNYPTYPSHPIW